MDSVARHTTGKWRFGWPSLRRMLSLLPLLTGCRALPALAQDLPALGNENPTPTQQQEVHRRTVGLIVGGSAAIAAYGRTHWWKDGFDGRFKTANEGWFGQDAYTGGADKAGHAYFTYLSGRLLARAFEWAGNDAEHARNLGVWTSLGTMTAVELIDAYSRRWSFSREDALMNVAGAGLAYLIEQKPELDRLIDFRLQYKPSADARHLNRFDPAGDHSGQTYLFVAKASGVPRLQNHPMLRYLELAAGYGSRGYEPDLHGERSRHVYFGISLNLSEVLRQTAYRGNVEPSRTQRFTETVFEYFQVPGTAALSDHRLSQ